MLGLIIWCILLVIIGCTLLPWYWFPVVIICNLVVTFLKR